MDKINDLECGQAGEHIVCADLLTHGYRAFMTEQICPYDVAVDVAGQLIRVQVKTTRGPRPIPQRKNYRAGYMWHVRRAGKGGARVYGADEFDMLALVALDRRAVAYMPPSRIRQTVHIRAHDDPAPSPLGGKPGKTFAMFPFGAALAEAIGED